MSIIPAPAILPATSVIMPTYNRGAMVEETLASVFAQTFANFEVVVVDDCSKDDTRARLARITDPWLKVIHAELNGGPVAARNIAFAAARGRFIAGLDQDDLCPPKRFATQLAFLRAHPEVVLVASVADLLEAGVVHPPRDPLRTDPMLIDGVLQLSNPLVWSSVMFRADAARKLPVLERQERLYAEDFDLYHRLAQFGAVARLDAPLVTYRIHGGEVSKMFVDRMVDSAAQVLAEAYAPIFWGRSARSCAASLPAFRPRQCRARCGDAGAAGAAGAAGGAGARIFVATRASDAAALVAIIAEYSRACGASPMLRCAAASCRCPAQWRRGPMACRCRRKPLRARAPRR